MNKEQILRDEIQRLHDLIAKLRQESKDSIEELKQEYEEDKRKIINSFIIATIFLITLCIIAGIKFVYYLIFIKGGFLNI